MPPLRVDNRVTSSDMIESDGGRGMYSRAASHGRQRCWIARGRAQSREEILKAYPYLEPEDIDEAVAYTTWRDERLREQLPSAPRPTGNR